MKYTNKYKNIIEEKYNNSQEAERGNRMGTEYKIRKTELKDAEQFVKLNILVWRYAYKDIFPESVFAEREKRVERNIENFSKHQLENPNGISYIAEIGGKIVGIMSGLYLS